ncbi:DNA internalization-related competence protein ComEC/Rec2 [Aestuariibacter halophilus]|uniref:DNA internalization-related competence protein ComEC/Rec2 n=1 Tax=Fluctibacter halophilus TaxID=226011 RepID=A0ABS8G5E5_9ALTE|nr:DNA internalization-related competence protein ComEC/Rec2 [Aestuariibacter halophilus]MCC2615341.1 DNA internalization-related competence protein ComEC/Rec2 [Aestuariibacter halophilus]
MDKSVCSFIAGCFCILLLPSLPPWWVITLCIGFAVVFLFTTTTMARQFAAALLGVVWMASVGHWHLYWQYPNTLLRQITWIEGSVASLHTGNEAALEFHIERWSARQVYPAKRIRLYWMDTGQTPRQGSRWRCPVRLSGLKGTANRGGFHFQQWLLSHGFHAKGAVTGHCLPLAADISLRQQIADRLLAQSLRRPGWLLALMIGERSGFTDADWHVLQYTGLSHMVAISGLHLGLVATVIGSCWYCCYAALCRLRLRCVDTSDGRVGRIWVMLSGCALYATVAGWSTPTLRAFVMLVIACLFLLRTQRLVPGRLLLWCLLVILLIQPLSVLSVSFWLSIVAVAVLIAQHWRFKRFYSLPRPWGVIVAALWMQAVLWLALMPLSAHHFGIVSAWSWPLNIVLVPLFACLLLPAILIALVLMVVVPGWASVMVAALDSMIARGVPWLDQLIGYGGTAQWTGLPWWAWLIWAAGLVWLCVPGARWRFSVLCLCALPLLSFRFSAPLPQWQVHVLDVGQGLAVAIETRQRAMLYDTGAAYPSGFALAQAVVQPALAHQGVASLDGIVISHFDNDHAGGLEWLREHFLHGPVLSSRDVCRRGMRLRWYQLTLQALWPPQQHHLTGNPSSCVLLIDDGQQRVLLTGDIDQAAEAQLIADYPDFAGVDVLVAPHHGSSTSSSPAFIRWASAQHVIFSQGLANRWGFPRQQVVDRYVRAGSQLWATGQHGQITWTAGKPQADSMTSYRFHHYPFWFANLPAPERTQQN